MTSDHERPGDFLSRRSERVPVASGACLSSATWFEVKVAIQNFSPCGFMAACDEPVGIGSAIVLNVPGIGEVEAQIRWQIGGRIGGMFRDPISLAQCDWTAVQADPPVAA